MASVIITADQQAYYINLGLDHGSSSIQTFNIALDSYICNNLLVFINFLSRKSSILIGNIKVLIKDFNIIILLFAKLYKTEIAFKLIYCAYILNFYLNILSVQKARLAEIYFNSRDIYLKNKDKVLFCSIYKYNGILLVNQNNLSRLALIQYKLVLKQKKYSFSINF